MAITRNNLLSGSSSANSATYTTGSFTPTGSRLLIACVSSHGNGPNNGEINTDTWGFTWVRLSDTTPGTSAWLAMFACITTGTPGAGTITFRPNIDDVTQSLCIWSIFEYDGADISGTVEEAFAQVATPAEGSSSSPAASLASFEDATNNVVVACSATAEFNVTPRTYTPGSGFSEIHEVSVNQGFFDVDQTLQTQDQTGEDTTVTWTLSGSANWGALAAEIRAAVSTVSGAIAASLATATATATGTQTQTGIIAATAQAAAAVLAGGMVPSGVLTATLDALTMTSTANVVSVVGTLAAELQALAAEAAGTQTQTGVVAAALQRVLAELAGAVVPDGDLAATLLPPTAAASGLMPPDGEMLATLEALSAELAGSQELSGQLLAAAVGLTMAAAGYMQPEGTLAGTLQTLAAAGVGEQVIVAVLSAALQNLTATAAATQTQSGSMVAALQLLTFAGIAALAVRLYGVPRDLLPPRSRLTQSPAKRVDPPSPHNELAKPASRLRPPRSRL